ncbi:MAG: branched-chain amino acid aminotransferase [Rhodobacteraceae bacterium]|nr:branched-chain amino acid aminotransferase [Paracoccaceae bacterium]
MVAGTNIKTYFNGTWHNENSLVMRAADHGAWLGSNVFDGARYAFGIAPDLDFHCHRINNSAIALGITPTKTPEEIHEIAIEGLKLYPQDSAVYIRPMYWAIDGGHMAVIPKEGSTGFCICLEEIPMPPDEATLTLTTTQFHRPVLATALVNAKAGCLYPNNGRMLREAMTKGFDNALVADAMGNVAETATSNVFMVKDGIVKTPIENGTFLAGVTRKRVISLLREEGHDVRESVLTFEDFHDADEVFTTGNMAKVVPVTRFDDTYYQAGSVARKAKKLYWKWAQRVCSKIV